MASKEDQAASVALQGQVVEDTHQLRAGDLLDLNVFQEPQMSTRQRVLSDGTISVGYLGRVKVADETVADAASKIEKMLNGKYLTDPQVSLVVTTYASRKFTVLGKVNSAGIFDIPPEGSTTLP
jgi:polysaccharide biosynthesis/export protein